jgi:NADH-quinone oxidoreductase subunit N
MLGFWAKVSVLQEAVNAGFVWLAVAGVVASIIGAYYYIRVVKVLYFDKPEDEIPLQASMDMRVLLSTNGILILALGLYPTALISLCFSAFA